MTAHDIEIRKLNFAFSEDRSPVWNAGDPEWSHMVNGASLVMPYLEPFLNRTLQEAKSSITDEGLLADVRGFVGQEAQHFTNHRRYNEMLKRNGYPELEEVEATLADSYKRLERRSLALRLAYSAGFETMTMGITEWLINDRIALFKGADPVIASLVLWHMVEETEHKSVAFDVYQALEGRYWLRILGLLHGSLHVGLLSRRGYKAMLKKDGRWQDLRARLRLWRLVAAFLGKAGVAMIRALRPDYHPDKVADPAWIGRWQTAYAHVGGDGLPILSLAAGRVEPVGA